MGVIRINRLRMQAHHGVLEQERRVGNTFEVSVELKVDDADIAASTDNIADTINYAEVVEIIKERMRKPMKLIEAVACGIATEIRNKYGAKVSGGCVTVAKLAPPISAELESVSYTYSW